MHCQNVDTQNNKRTDKICIYDLGVGNIDFSNKKYNFVVFFRQFLLMALEMHAQKVENIN